MKVSSIIANVDWQKNRDKAYKKKVAAQSQPIFQNPEIVESDTDKAKKSLVPFRPRPLPGWARGEQ